MQSRTTRAVFVMALAILAALTSTTVSKAGLAHAPRAADSPFDLVNAVNALRASYGLSAYSINSILMYTAQAQADFMAASGTVSHTGLGGSSVTDRLLAAGYPLAGDLSLGGLRSENIASGGENSSAQSIVNGWTGDSIHLHTMTSPNLTEIGAGVAVANGRVYYVIDCALPRTGGAPPASSPVAGSGSSIPAREALIPVVVISTPNSSGEVIHEVLPGQSLWQIAIAYEVKIDDIKRLNSLAGNNIYPGDKLLIKQHVLLPTASPTEVLVIAPTPTWTNAVASPTSTILPTAAIVPTAIISSSSPDANSIMGIAIGIIALALLGGGVFTWLGSSRKE